MGGVVGKYKQVAVLLSKAITMITVKLWMT